MELNLTTRTIKGKTVKSLRKKEIIPAVSYGNKLTPQLLQVNYLDFKKAYEEAGESTLIDLKIDNKTSVKALIHDVERDYLSDRYSHVDFYQIKKGEKVIVEVELEYVGVSKAIKELEGVLVKNMNKIRIECLPEDLIHNIQVDISKLNTFSDLIKVKDLPIPAKIKILEKMDEVVALVIAPRAEEVVAETVVEAAPVEGEAAKVENKEEAEKDKPAKDAKKDVKKEAKK